jgi:L-ascorbate metabolism protein UlaG (beta-lactamase superfamily)
MNNPSKQLTSVIRFATFLLVFTAVSLSCTRIEPAPFVPSPDRNEEIPTAASIEVRYIANEGVLISSRDGRVLIDGLHRRYKDDYAFLPDAEREKIEAARPPFDRIDLVLVSHLHGDHFDPDSVGRYLKNNTKAVFASSQQVVDEVATKFAEYGAIKERITPITYTLKSIQPVKIAGIDVTFLGVGHGSGRHASIQNLGHIISLGGKKLLHIGDADISDEIFDAFDLEQQRIDVAFLPSWFLTSKDGQALIERHIRPKHIIAVHVGPGDSEEITREVKKNFPAADVFSTMLEKRVF